MGRPKGGTNKYWSTEEKLRIVLRVENDEKTLIAIAKEEGVYRSLLNKWLKDYRRQGKEGLINQKKRGNPLLGYQSKKELTDYEKLEYEYMKLRIENARLKKGYTTEEVMKIREKKSSGKNMKL